MEQIQITPTATPMPTGTPTPTAFPNNFNTIIE